MISPTIVMTLMELWNGFDYIPRSYPVTLGSLRKDELSLSVGTFRVSSVKEARQGL